MRRAIQPRLTVLLTLWGCALAGCGDAGSTAADAGPDARIPGPAQALFHVPALGEALDEGFFALPYPNDLRIREDGLTDLTGLARPNALLELYVDAVEQRQHGFGLTSGLYVRFDGAIDPATLPSEPIRAQIPAASVYLVNLEPSSENYGRKLPMEFGFHAEGNSLIGANWLGCLPFPGFVMEEESTYALVVTDRLLAEDGSPITASPEFEAVLSTSPPGDARLARAREIYQPLTSFLDEEGGDERADVVNAAVFTTQNATGLIGKFRKFIYDELEPPEPRDVRWVKEEGSLALYSGRFDSPYFQAGNYPYKSFEQGGGFEFDSSTGAPILQGMNDLRFAMSIPTREKMPEAGWPVVLYAHGSGGDYLTFERNGTARRMAEQGIAVLSIDQVMHGDRLVDGDSITLFFNFQNPLSSRNNVIQAGLEDFQLVRLASVLDIVERHRGGRSIRFDADKLYFFGHSQGSSTGVGFVAQEPLIKGAIFSGAAGLLYLSLMTKTKPFDVSATLSIIIRDNPFDRFHPALALLQGFFEPADPIVYGRLLVEEPAEGNDPKNIFQPLGFGDSYTTVPTMEAMATAIGVDQAAPQLEPIAGLELRDRHVLTVPITDNAGEVTSVVAQYNQLEGSDGHFVSFDIEAARVQTTMFIKTLVNTGHATVVAP